MGSEEGKKIKVKITKSSGENYWYDNEVGNTFLVKEWINNSYITDKFWTIRTSDCEVVTEEKLKVRIKSKDEPFSEYKFYNINEFYFVEEHLKEPSLYTVKEGVHTGKTVVKSDCLIVNEEDSLQNKIAKAIDKTIEDVNVLAKTNEHIGEVWKQPKVSLDLTKDENWMANYAKEKGLDLLHVPEINSDNSRDETKDFAHTVLDMYDGKPKNIEITIDGQTYFINRKAWVLEQTFRKLRNQLYERQISQEGYDQSIKKLIAEQSILNETFLVMRFYEIKTKLLKKEISRETYYHEIENIFQ